MSLLSPSLRVRARSTCICARALLRRALQRAHRPLVRGLQFAIAGAALLGCQRQPSSATAPPVEASEQSSRAHEGRVPVTGPLAALPIPSGLPPLPSLEALADRAQWRPQAELRRTRLGERLFLWESGVGGTLRLASFRAREGRWQLEASGSLTADLDCAEEGSCAPYRSALDRVPAALSERPLFALRSSRQRESALGALEEEIILLFTLDNVRWGEIWRGELKSELLPNGPGESLKRRVTLHAEGPLRNGFRTLLVRSESRARSFNLVDPGEAEFEEPEESELRYLWQGGALIKAREEQGE